MKFFLKPRLWVSNIVKVQLFYVWTGRRVNRFHCAGTHNSPLASVGEQIANSLCPRARPTSGLPLLVLCFDLPSILPGVRRTDDFFYLGLCWLTPVGSCLLLTRGNPLTLRCLLIALDSQSGLLDLLLTSSCTGVLPLQVQIPASDTSWPAAQCHRPS